MTAPDIPVTVIGGYLGAGKTTLVNHLLRHADGIRIAVLVNDFGDLPIDADLIESRDGDVMNLAGGCVCCSFGSDLMGALMALPSRSPRPDHVLIETSGVALPGAVARTLTLVAGMARQAVLVVADAPVVRERAEDRYVGDTVRQQLAQADLVILNKSDLIDEAVRAQLRHWLARECPGTRTVEAHHGALPPALLLGPAASAEAAGLLRARRPFGPLDAASVFESMSFEFTEAIDAAALGAALADPALSVLRAKALLRDADGTARVLHVVGARWDLHASAHADPATGRLVCIGLRARLDGRRIGEILDRLKRGNATAAGGLGSNGIP